MTAGGCTNKVKVWSADSAETAAEVAALALPAVRLPHELCTVLGQQATDSSADAKTSCCTAGPLCVLHLQHLLCMCLSDTFMPESASDRRPLLACQGEENFKKERFVLSVAYSPDGRRLACGSMDGTVGVFDTASGKLLHTLDGHFKPIRSLTFTPGKFAWSGTPGSDLHSLCDSPAAGPRCCALMTCIRVLGNCSRWQVAHPACHACRLEDAAHSMRRHALAPVRCGARLAHRGLLRCGPPADCNRAQHMDTLAAHLSTPLQAQHNIIIWRHCAGHESWVLSVAVHPGGNAFVTGSSDSKVRLFDLQSRTCAQNVAEHSDQVRCCGPSAGGCCAGLPCPAVHTPCYDLSAVELTLMGT